MQSTRALTPILLLTGAVLANARDAAAQDAIFDAVRVIQATGSVCHRAPRYTVVEVALKDQVGSDHFVGDQRRSCAPDSLPGDFVIRNEWAEYFAGLRGPFLILDSGTGDDARGLFVFNLETQTRTFVGAYVALEFGGRGDTVGVWQPYALSAPRPECPGVDSLVWLDLRAGRTRFAGRVRCATRQ